MQKQAIKIWFDGACWPVNPGGIASWGFIIKIGETVYKKSGAVGEGDGMTNNVAEYAALIAALTLADSLVANRDEFYLEIRGDSKLVIYMVNGDWGGMNPHPAAPHLRVLLDQTLELLDGWEAELAWLPRDRNEEADALSNKGYSEYIEANPASKYAKVKQPTSVGAGTYSHGRRKFSKGRYRKSR